MNERKLLSDIADSLVEKHSMDKKDAELFVKNMFELIKETLSTEKYVKIKGLGTFKLTEVDTRESVNVNTGERIEIQGHVKVTFTPDTAMKELINKPFSHFETVVLNDGVQLEDALPEEDVEQEAGEGTDDVQSIVEEVVVADEKAEVAEAECLVSSNEETVEEVAFVAETAEEDVKQEEQIVEEVVDVPQAETIVGEEMEQAPVDANEESELSVEESEVVTTAEEATVAAAAEEEEEEEKQDDVQQEYVAPEVVSIPKNKEKRTIRMLWGIIIILILVILCGCYWVFVQGVALEETPVVPVQKEQMLEKPIMEEVKEDTLFVDTKTENFVSEKVDTVAVLLPVNMKNRVASLADTLDYRIVGTKTIHTLQSGESIIKASVKYFGSKMFWPYIVKHNRDVIKNPDDIPIGTQIKIPELVPKN